MSAAAAVEESANRQGPGLADFLVVSNAYPRADSLYRYQFLHARVKAYLARGLKVDVYCVDYTAHEPGEYMFEGVRVMYGNSRAFAEWVAGTHYEKYLVHFPHDYLLEPIRVNLPQARVVLWLHGYEVQKWHRRWFNVLDDETLGPDEMEGQKQLCERRIAYLREFLTSHANVRVVTVSEWFLRRTIEPDLGLALRNVSVIPNFIDTDMFKYLPKGDADATKVLVVRPFTARKYAGQEIVDTIVGATRASGGEIQFTVVGEGPQFERLTRPLRDLKNVDLRQGYVTRAQIQALHGSHGVYLNPTYWDSQGVSTGEAMSSGLVPLSTAVSAVPEFVEHLVSGLLVSPTDSGALVNALITLAERPELFRALSSGAASRVRAQCSSDMTIDQELDIITGDPANTVARSSSELDWSSLYQDLERDFEWMLTWVKRQGIQHVDASASDS